jgi:tripartite ATP-independent transporter DctP family solute receptor
MSPVPPRPVGRRRFLAGAGAALSAAACRSRDRDTLILRLSHSMNAARTTLHLFADAFRAAVDEATSGAVIVRIFPSGTLGQEREIVQQLQEGLVDFMVSGTAIWGSVAPRLQFFDFPFLWRDWNHVHRMVDGPLGQEAAEYAARTVRVRPLAWADSFGFRHVVTRSRDVTEPGHLAGLKIRTIQSSIYVKAVELMGASPTPMAFGEVYTSLQTGVIDGYEHDPSTTLQQHFHEVARYMTKTAHIAGVLGLFASTAAFARFPPELGAIIRTAAIEAAQRQRAIGPREEDEAMSALRAKGMTIRELDRGAFERSAVRLWEEQAAAIGAASWLEAARA